MHVALKSCENKFQERKGDIVQCIIDKSYLHMHINSFVSIFSNCNYFYNIHLLSLTLIQGHNDIITETSDYLISFKSRCLLEKIRAK